MDKWGLFDNFNDINNNIEHFQKKKNDNIFKLQYDMTNGEPKLQYDEIYKSVNNFSISKKQLEKDFTDGKIKYLYPNIKNLYPNLKKANNDFKINIAKANDLIGYDDKIYIMGHTLDYDGQTTKLVCHILEYDLNTYKIIDKQQFNIKKADKYLSILIGDKIFIFLFKLSSEYSATIEIYDIKSNIINTKNITSNKALSYEYITNDICDFKLEDYITSSKNKKYSDTCFEKKMYIESLKLLSYIDNTSKIFYIDNKIYISLNIKYNIDFFIYNLKTNTWDKIFMNVFLNDTYNVLNVKYRFNSDIKISDLFKKRKLNLKKKFKESYISDLGIIPTFLSGHKTDTFGKTELISKYQLFSYKNKIHAIIFCREKLSNNQNSHKNYLKIFKYDNNNNKWILINDNMIIENYGYHSFSMAITNAIVEIKVINDDIFIIPPLNNYTNGNNKQGHYWNDLPYILKSNDLINWKKIVIEVPYICNKYGIFSKDYLRCRSDVIYNVTANNKIYYILPDTLEVSKIAQTIILDPKKKTVENLFEHNINYKPPKPKHIITHLETIPIETITTKSPSHPIMKPIETITTKSPSHPIMKPIETITTEPHEEEEEEIIIKKQILKLDEILDLTPKKNWMSRHLYLFIFIILSIIISIGIYLYTRDN